MDTPPDPEVSNDMARATLTAVVRAMTRGESDRGHTRLTVEFQDGLVRRAFVERTLGAAELVPA